MTVDANSASLLRPIVGIENRTAQEVFDIMCDRFRLAALPASDHEGLVERLRLSASVLRNSDMPAFMAGELEEAATALSAASPAPLEGVTDELVERAFKDGLAYGSNVEGADPETAWQHSRARLALKNQESDRG